MSKAPLVSIIIPVYNAKEYLAQSLDCAINQKYRRLEVIVVDDGSTDESNQIIEEFASKDSRIISTRIENQGPSVARNTGIDMANGSFITFLDADDLFSELFLQRMISQISGADVCVCKKVRWNQRTGKCRVDGWPEFYGTKEELRKWVNFALKNDAIIFYDAAYHAYIQDENIPHSIYEIKGARRCAIEFHSYSKTAGFTGLRCGYTVVPKELTAVTLDGTERHPLNPLWDRRQCTKFNGTSYISQRAAEAIYTPEGKQQVKDTIDYYMTNARLMHKTLSMLGLKVYGGVNAPYLWVKTPDGTPSWKFFEQMLYGAQVVCTPGVGFGPSGEGFIRLTSFGDRADCEEALHRISRWILG